MAIGHQLGLRLFLEGVEVPVISAQISIAPDCPAAASIQIIATDTSLEILPRTVVHLFFYDFVDSGNPLTGKVNEGSGRYRLLFMGEVQGLGFSKEVGSRSAILSCVDFSNYWDTTYQYNFGGSLFGGRRQAAFIGANANLLTSPLGHGTGFISRLLASRSVNFPDLRGLLAGIVHVLESIGGAYYGDNTFQGANIFTSLAELRCKINQQICAAAKDTSTARLFRRKTFNMWMNNEIGGLGKLVTFRGLVQIMQRFIYHEVFPCPAAYYQPAEIGKEKTVTVSTDISKDPRSRSYVAMIKELSTIVDSAKEDLEACLRTPRFAKSKYENDDQISLQSSLIQISDKLKMIKSSGVPKIQGADLEAQTANLSTAFNNVKKQICSTGLTTDSAYLADSVRNNAARDLFGSMQDTISLILDNQVKRNKLVKYDKLDRVNNQVFRPDIWFSAAPRCNVLFPENYTSLQWQRNFMREVSRIELQTTHEILGSDALINPRYYAPDVKDLRDGVKLSSRKFKRLIMAHEILTGIIPMYEKMTQANIYAMRSGSSAGMKVPYVQRAVNHQFFKHRFASRSLSVSGRFNPWIVPGFPTLIIDKPMSAQQLLIAAMSVEEANKALNIVPVANVKTTRATILQDLVSPQFYGSCVQVEHSITQQGGMTSYSLDQARTHREDTEFLGVDKADVNEVIGTSSVKGVYAVDGANVPVNNQRGPRGGVITRTRDVTTQYRGRTIPVFPGIGRFPIARMGESLSREMSTGPYTETTLAPEANMSSVAGMSAAPRTVNVSADPNPANRQISEVLAYEITETITRRRRRIVDLPIEEAVRPPWIWDGWRTLKIGETYAQMFGTNAITDVEGYAGEEAYKYLINREKDMAMLESQEAAVHGNKRPKQGNAPEGVPSPATLPAVRNMFDLDAKRDAGVGTSEYGKAEDSKLSANTAFLLAEDRTIEACIDYLIRVYSVVRASNMDVGSFIRNYTWRPIATLEQILGSPDLVIVNTDDGGAMPKRGTEGFHSRSFGDVASLFGLVNPDVKNILGLTAEKDHAVAEKLDVRKRRRDVIVEYSKELTDSRGLLG